MEEAGSGLQLEFIQKFTDQTLTSTGFPSAVDNRKLTIDLPQRKMILGTQL